MKKLLLLAFAAAALLPAQNLRAQESVAHGYQMGDSKNMFGFISFPVSQHLTPTMDKRNFGETHVSAGECVDGIYYTYEVYPDVMGGTSAYSWCVRNASTFEKISETVYPYSTNRVVDMTYDYTTNTMYALVENAVSTGTLTLTSLNVVDLATGQYTLVGTPGDLKAVNGNGKEVDEALITLAADATGQLYAMGEYRQFYSLDKITGKATQIGSQHGIATANQFQSMAFDSKGVLYWAQTHPDYGYLLTIDPTTGVPSYMAPDPNPDTKWKNEASLLGDDAEVTGLWFEKPFAGTAPATVTNLSSAIATDNANKVTLHWALPTKDLKGNPTTLTAVKVFRFGTPDPIATLGADATTYTDPAAPNGNTSYMVCAVSEAGQGRGACTTLFTGADALMPVGNLSAALDGTTVTVTWTAPTATKNGGYADYNNITYRVWRICGDTEEMLAQSVAETTYTDELTKAGTYFYSIEPVSCGVVGYAKDSNTVTYTTTMGIPYSTGFDDAGDGPLWTFANNHSNASYGWSIALGIAYQRLDGKFAQLKSYSSSEPCNDYMFSPAIAFTPGNYTLSYWLNGSVAADAHSWDIYLSKTPSADAEKAVQIESHTNEKPGNTWIASTPANFTVAEAGNYHLVFHGKTTDSYCTLKIDNVRLDNSGSGALGTVEVEDAEPEFFTLQGIKVENPTSGYYIMRRGAKATKVYIR